VTFMDVEVAEFVRDMERDERIARKAESLLDQGREPMDPGRLMDFVPRIYDGAEDPPITAPLHLEPFVLDIERALARLVVIDLAHTPPIERCFSMPVRHGKTTLIIAAIVWILLWYPKAQILVASHAEWLAAKTVNTARSLAVIAGIRRGPKWTQKLWTTSEGGRVKATGWNGQLTGDGFHFIFVDDPHKNRAEAESAPKRLTVNSGFYSNIYTRKLPLGTSKFVVHARWNVHDLIGYIMERSKTFAYVNLPAIRELGDGTVTPLAPHMYTLEQLLAERDEVGPYVWASLYQGQPRPREAAVFKTDPIVMPEKAIAPKGGFVDAIGVDFARTSNTRSDNQAAVVVRKHASGEFDVLDAAFLQGPIDDEVQDERVIPGFVHQLARLCRAFPKAPVVWYGGKSEGWLRKVCEKPLIKLLGRHVRIEILDIESRDKWVRAQLFGGAWNAGLVRIVEVRDRFDQRNKGLDAFVSEVAGFTGSPGCKDDLVDAAVAAFDHLQGRKPGSSGPRRALSPGPQSEAEQIGGLV
jgi:hypothetical protein